MDQETLTVLLRGGHVNMTERVKRALWPHPPLQFSEVLVHLVDLLHQNTWFPREWRPHRNGEMVSEGGTIERKGPDLYVYRAARAHPIQPYVLADCSERVFSSAEDAARHYLRWDLHLPGHLDGWKVIE